MNENVSSDISIISEDSLTPFERAQLNAYFFAKNINLSVEIQAFFDASEAATKMEEKFLEKAYLAFIEDSLADVEYN